jgi:hypothetical protein
LKGVGKEEVTIEQDTVIFNAEGPKRVVKEFKKEVKRMTTQSEENVSVWTIIGFAVAKLIARCVK